MRTKQGHQVRLVGTETVFPSVSVALRHLGAERSFNNLRTLRGDSPSGPWELEPLDEEKRKRVEQFRRKQRASIVWPPAQVAVLEQLANQHPTRRIAQIYNQTAGMNGWRKRSLQAIRHRLRQLGDTNQATEDGWNPTWLARELGLQSQRIHHWIRRGRLPRRRVGGRLVIYREDMKELARRSPHLLGGLDYSNLLWLLEDADWVKRLLRDYPRPPAQLAPNPILRPLDGRVWPSATELARELHVTYAAVHSAIKDRHRCQGHFYCRLDDYRRDPEQFRYLR